MPELQGYGYRYLEVQKTVADFRRRISWHTKNCMTWDVTVIDTLAESYLLTTSSSTGEVAEGAGDQKELNAYAYLNTTGF
jgi:hypothetical protein